jgi:hypothetical protein
MFSALLLSFAFLPWLGSAKVARVDESDPVIVPPSIKGYSGPQPGGFDSDLLEVWFQGN